MAIDTCVVVESLIHNVWPVLKQILLQLVCAGVALLGILAFVVQDDIPHDVAKDPIALVVICLQFPSLRTITPPELCVCACVCVCVWARSRCATTPSPSTVGHPPP